MFAARCWSPLVGATLLALSVPLVLLGAACDSPSGVVLTVRGASAAGELWLTVGADGTARRFKQQAEETGQISHPAPFADGFEIYLDRDELLAQPQVALVLDSIIGKDAQLDVQRDTYVVAPEAGNLLEVQLQPRALGPGQWVCAGRASVDADGFTIARDDRDVDCDRDGWLRADDLDDADPLLTGDIKWQPGAGLCQVMLGSHTLGLQLSDDECMLCGRPSSPNDLASCISSLSAERCTAPRAGARFSVRTLMPALGPNPEWELIRLGPPGASAVFAPSNRAPDEWSVEVASSDSRFAGFMLVDRTRGQAAIIAVEFKDAGEEPKCE